MLLLNLSDRLFCLPHVAIAPVARAAAVAMVLVHLTVSTAHAQKSSSAALRRDGAQSWVHESWTVKDGLPVNSINAIVQDRTGYIWAATFDGLVRFDGLRFTVFNSANSEELPSNRIIELKEGRDGSLWLTTEPVSYTHLRAHETPEHLVCRLLLEK